MTQPQEMLRMIRSSNVSFCASHFMTKEANDRLSLLLFEFWALDDNISFRNDIEPKKVSNKAFT